jgi:hypothetical protein
MLEPIGRQSRIADRGHDRAVPEIGLDGASVVPVVGELEPAGVPQHVGMNRKCRFRGHARPGHHTLISGCGKRSATFRDEDVGGCWSFAQELAQRPTFPGKYREVERLIEAAKHNRSGHRDATAMLVAYRHGLRASEQSHLGAGGRVHTQGDWASSGGVQCSRRRTPKCLSDVCADPGLGYSS